MKEIIIIAFGSAKENYDKPVSFLRGTYRIKRLGVDFDVKLALELAAKYCTQCDIIGFSGFPTDIKINGKTHTHEQVLKLRRAVGDTPYADGSHLKSLAMPLFLRNLTLKEPEFFKNKSIAFYSGISQWDYIPSFNEMSSKLIFADPYSATMIPKIIHGSASLQSFMGLMLPFLKKINLEKFKARDFTADITKLGTMRDFFKADIYVVNKSQLNYLKLQNLAGKTVIIDRLDSFSKEILLKANVEKVYSCYPDFKGLPKMEFDGLEALLLAHTNKQRLEPEDLLDLARNLNLSGEVFSPKLEVSNPVGKFSFIIHPLMKSQLFFHPAMKPFMNSPIAPKLEQLISKAPGFYYGNITGIKSVANGKEVEGELFAIPMTPRTMLKQNPEKFYGVLHKVCQEAFSRGSKIIGLGAYTKIVGDAGVTVNERSPIPVTTGNSLSASATLWAASFAIEKMNLVTKENSKFNGTAMVIGATGSIGKVCARILCHQWKKVIIAAPRPYKVLELEQELKLLYPDVEVIGTSNPDRYSHECDLIITSTSAQGESVLDISKVKSGCVICDVSRPFDISLDEASSRPDVLVVASGEVELPGDVRISKTLNLPGSTVYACLAETALLAMEGRHESFSISRDLTYEKVVEIDRLARKHGVRLSAIMGHTGEISEDEIRLCREHALRVRAGKALA